VLGVVLDIGLRSERVGDLLFRTRRLGLVRLELRDAVLARAGDVVVRLRVWRHGGSFGR
jgi:hypothetical protein